MAISSLQHSAVSEGVVLVLIMCDRVGLAWANVRIDLSFEGAQHLWPYLHRIRKRDLTIAPMHLRMKQPPMTRFAGTYVGLEA